MTKKRVLIIMYIAIIISISGCNQGVSYINDKSFDATPDCQSYDVISIANSRKKIKFELLHQNDNLVLNADNDTFIIDQGSNYELINEKPKLHHIQTDTEDYILITVIWRTNKVGSTVSMWCYNFKTNNITEIGSGLEQIRYAIKIQDQITELSIPQCNANFEIKIDDRYIDIYPPNGEFEFSKHVDYEIKDIDEDNVKEVITKRVISTGAINWSPIQSVYTTYKISNGGLKPISFMFD